MTDSAARMQAARGMPTPADYERIVIVGAGGFGREVLQWARHTWPHETAKIAGFLSADPRVLEGHATAVPMLGSPADFVPGPRDAFLLAIGIPGVRRSVVKSLLRRGARFLSLVHPTAVVADSASIGTGSIICPFAVVSDAARVGAYAILNYHSSIAHDSTTGDFTVMSPYATIAGQAHVGEESFLGLHASVGPRVRVGDRCKVSANSVVLHDAAAGSVVFGVPGRTMPNLATAGGAE